MKVTVLKKLTLERSPKTYKEVKAKDYEPGDILTNVHADWKETMLANPDFFKVEQDEEVQEDKK